MESRKNYQRSQYHQGNTGVREANIAFGSGLRSNSGFALFQSEQTIVVNAQPVGGAASAAVTAFTNLALTGINRLQYGVTPCAHVVQASPNTATLQLRVKGYDQFGDSITETTPVVDLTAVTNNFVYLSKVFTYIEKVEFKSTGLDIAGDTLSLGSRFDWLQTESGSNHHVAGENLGIGLPMRLAHRPRGAGGNYVLDNLPRLESGSIGELVFSGNAVAAQTVTIGSRVYTWRASAALANEVLVGASATDSRDNLRAAINREAGEGTLYGTGTVQHPTVRAEDVGSTTLKILSREKGAKTSAIATAETMTNAAWTAITASSATRMRGGRNRSGEAVVAVNGMGFPSVGYLTFTGQPGNTQTVTIGTTVYTFVTALASPFDVLIGASTEASIDNLVSAINGTAGAGSTYGTGTTPHPAVRATKRGTTVCRIHSRFLTGGGENTVATTETVANASWGAATMVGGSGSSTNTSDETSEIGNSASGWEGCLEKFRTVDPVYLPWYGDDSTVANNILLCMIRAFSMEHILR